MIVVHQRWTEPPAATGLQGALVEAMCIVPVGEAYSLYSAFYDPNKGQTLSDAYWWERGHMGHMPGVLVSALNRISGWPGAADLVSYGQTILEACSSTYQACRQLDPNLSTQEKALTQTPWGMA